ncbi:MAG TPA: hypothetical protein VMT16_02410, partial [Thermoanaerobaculia bacterium]|nr:hypothetical protein [Thermoanaerobaculia bacterium]
MDEIHYTATRNRSRAVLRIALAGLLAAAAAEATPQFARRYAVGCGQCHVLPPKLNAFGEQFLASG